MDSNHSGAVSSGPGDVTPTGTGPGSATNPKMRKRTKTGCLTCRKRRIKCGEERPTCANCIKSKRQCEGYNQRVVFKPPLGDWPNHPGVVSTLQYHNSLLPGSRAAPYRSPPGTQARDPHLSLQPRPTEFDFSNVNTGPVPGSDHLGFARPYGTDPYQQPLHSPHHQQPLHSPHHQQPLHSPHHQLPTPTSATSYFPTQSPVHTNFQAPYTNDPSTVYSQRYTPGAHYQHMPVSHDTQVDQKSVVSPASNLSESQPYHEQAAYHQPRSAGIPEEQSSYPFSSDVPARVDEYAQYSEQRPSLTRYGSNPRLPVSQSQHAAIDLGHNGSYAAAPLSHADSTHSNFQTVQIPTHNVHSDVKYPQHAVLEQPVAVSQAQQKFQPQLLLSGFGGDDHVSPTQVLDEAAVEYEDDDYYDVQSDEEMLDAGDDDAIISNKDFGLMQQLHRESNTDLSIRRYDAFIYDGVLTNYRAENVANPLKNPKTARVFAHFICVTGPSISIYERHPRNPASLFDGLTPLSQQSLWTHTLPLKALKHQGLLHAMLALASLHIAKLQRASVTPSYKHYAYAIKRLHRCLGHPRKRLQITTLATSLLLAFYEVMTAEHVKWSTHLVGAAQLLAEFDFRSLTQEARRLRALQTQQEEMFPYQNPGMLIDQRQYEQKLKETTVMPDENLVSTIVGKQVSYDDFGRVVEEDTSRPSSKKGPSGKLDLRNYEVLQDLYWWYSRQDAYQSIISGNPLIMSYHRWSDCPPRAPLGRTDALCGTHDHIQLLIGRIADFTVKDRERKLRQVKADGGSWRPRPGMPGMGPQPQPQGRGQPPPTPTTPMGPPPHMQMGMGGPPPGWTGGPPPGWIGTPPPGRNGGPPVNGPPPSQPGFPPQNQGGMPQMPRGPPPGASAGPDFFGMAPAKPPVPLPTSYENPNYQSDSPQSPNSPDTKYADLPAAYDAAIADWNSISHAHATMAQILTNTPGFQPLPADVAPPIPGQGVASNMTPFGPALMHRSYDISILWGLLHLSKILLIRAHPAMPPAAMMASGVAAPATAPYAVLIGRISAGMQMPTGELTPSIGAALIESSMPLFFAGVQYQDAAQREWLVNRLLDIDQRTGWASAGIIARSCETAWERAAQMGRGPPHVRKTRAFGREGPVLDPHSADEGSGGSGWGGEGIVRGGQRDKEEDMRFVVRYPKGDVPWAMNILATDEDLRVGMERVGIGGEINAAGTERERRN